MTTTAKIDEVAGRYLHYIKACNLLNEKNGLYSLTKEGVLLARFYISPKSYLGYIKTARKLAACDLPGLDKGCILLSLILNISKAQECPPRFEKDILMQLIPLELEKDVSAAKSGLLKYYTVKFSAMPQFLPYQLRDADRWISMFADLEKYGVHKETPGKAWVSEAVVVLKTASAKMLGRKKPNSGEKPAKNPQQPSLLK